MGHQPIRQYVHLIYNEQSDGFRNLDRKLRNLIIGVARNQNTFDELKVLIQAEIASGKQHVSQEFEKGSKFWEISLLMRNSLSRQACFGDKTPIPN